MFPTRRIQVKNRASLFCLALALLCVAPAVKAQTNASAPPQGAAANANKIAVIRMQYAIVNTAAGKQASAEINSQFAPRRVEMDGIKKQIDDIQKQLTTQASMLSEEEVAKKERAGKVLSDKLQRLTEELQEEGNAAEADAIDLIGKRLLDVVSRYAKENGYAVVIDGSNQQAMMVLYAATTADITDDVVNLYDKQYPVKAAAAPAPAPKQPGTTPPATQTPPAKKPGGPGGNL
jgi:outer membrane protein